MKELSIIQLEKVLGGYNQERCAMVQALANKYGSVMSEWDWENLWLPAYDKFCS